MNSIRLFALKLPYILDIYCRIDYVEFSWRRIFAMTVPMEMLEKAFCHGDEM